VETEIRSRLRRISEGYSDTLTSGTRARLLASARQASHGGWLSSPFVPTFSRVLAVAAVLVVLALPALQMRPRQHEGTPSLVRDLEVTEVGGQVVLTWKDGNQPRRVVKATSREQLAHLSQLPSETVSGERWVDSHPGDEAVVYYIVE
jgi:anti-sigma-K factor RskA